MGGVNKLIPKCLTAWTPIYRTTPYESDENQKTLQALAQATEGYRNGEIDEKQQQKDKRRQAFTNAMLAGAMAEDPEMMIASGWRQNKEGDFVLDLIDDLGVKALRNNLAVLGATGTAVMAPQVITALAPTVSEGIAPIVATTKAVTNSVKPVLTTVKKYKKPIKWITGTYPFASLGFNIGKIKLKETKDNREYEENKPYYQESIDRYLNVYKLNESQQSIIDLMDRTDDLFLLIYDWANAGELDYR